MSHFPAASHFLAMERPHQSGDTGSAPLRTYDCPLGAEAASARTARLAVRRELGEWGATELVEDCTLIVTELVTNAVRHGDGSIHLRLGTNGQWVYGEVYDGGDRLPHVRSTDPDATGGRGLLIVDRLADEWGVAQMPGGGKLVWFLLGTGGGIALPQGA